MRSRIVIVGAGVAGLAAADALSCTGALRARFDVTVLESAPRAGGKCGAVALPDGGLIEHGPHVLAGWYVNTREALASVGADRHLVDIRGLSLLAAGEHTGRLRCFEPPTSPLAAARLFTRGPLPPAGMARYVAMVADLVAEAEAEVAADPSWDARRADRVRERVQSSQAAFDDAIVLGALAVAGDEASARTMARTTAFYLRTPRPYLSALDGPMHDLWIAPWVQRLERAGVVLECGVSAEAVQEGPAVRIAGEPEPRGADAVVLATPAEVTRRLVTLPRAEELQVGPMGALDVWVEGLGGQLPAVVLLEGSGHALTFTNVTGLWRDQAADGHDEPGVRLSVIVPASVAVVADDPTPLLAEITQRLGGAARITAHRWRANLDAPLFLNTCGSWAARPEPDGVALDGVWLAGDWVRHPIEVAVIEGAIWSGREAARRVAVALGVQGVRSPLTPPTLPRQVVRLMSRAGRALTGI